MEYRSRFADKELRDTLEALGAVLIVGPKWCGKTTTAEQIARSSVYMQDPARIEEYREMMNIDPSLLLAGEKPRLIDEWQTAPGIWDAVRYNVDRLSEEGLYILTGSTAVDTSKILHSGAGRIGRIKMSTMSLYESDDSTGDVSLFDMFAGKDIEGISRLSLENLAELVVRGGWPKSIGKAPDVAHKQIKNYCETILESDIKTVDGMERDRHKMYLILRSISRNISTPAPDTTILSDVKKNDGTMHLNTLRSYENVLRSIYVIDDLPAWTPKLRSKATMRTSATRHLTDPAIAAYFLGASAKDLLADVRTFGLLFESMVVRDLRVYARALDGEVFYYRDSYGLEADAIIHLRDGRWGAIEVKLGSGMIDDAAKNLIRIEQNIDGETAPSFLAVVTGTEYAYRREDGVYVVPIGCLKN